MRRADRRTRTPGVGSVTDPCVYATIPAYAPRHPDGEGFARGPRADRPIPVPEPTVTPVRRLALIAAMCLVLGLLGGVLAADLKGPTPAAARFIPPALPGYDFKLHDESGRVRTLADARGSVIVVAFVYSTCRDVCPAGGNVISTALHDLGDAKVQAYFISVDPVGDTTARTQRWLARRGLTGRGHYLIGSRAQLEHVWRHYAIAPINASRAERLAAAKRSD